jgi:hypothetical protein
VKRILDAVRSRLLVPIDLAILRGWRDLFLVLGFVALIRGIAFYSVPLAWIASGVGVMALSFLMAEQPMKQVPKSVPEQPRRAA